MQPLIQTEDLAKIYHRGKADEKTAVAGVSFSVQAGAVTILKGASGCGKSTLLSLVGCMSRPTSGIVRVAGRDVSRLPEGRLTEVRRRTFGFIFQQFNLVRGVSLLENVMLPLYPEPVGVREMVARADAVLDRLGLLEKRKRTVQQLSGGEQQRAAIARALINDPQIIIADEPSAHLDSRLTEELLRIFASLQQEGKTLLVATHDPAVYHDALVDTVLTMRDGLLVEDGG